MYYCILDFEATCWDSPTRDNQGKPHEIIEFPSVLYKVNDKNRLEYVSEFQKYCKPVLNPKLSAFCTELTGIEQKTVDSAELFPYVMNAHYKWLLKSTDNQVNDVIFVTCGAWDFSRMLVDELRRWVADKQLVMELHKFMQNPPAVYWGYMNIKTLFTKFYNVKAGGMVSMLKKLKLKLDGRHHSGLDDCKNISKILIKIFNSANGDFSQYNNKLFQRVNLKPIKKKITYAVSNVM